MSGDLRTNRFLKLFSVFYRVYRGAVSLKISTFTPGLSCSVSSSYSPPGHRFEDVPGVRRHLVRKSTKGQIVHIGKDHKEPTTRTRKQDRTPHEVKRYSQCILTLSARAQGFDDF